jgi:hypothetical protein
MHWFKEKKRRMDCSNEFAPCFTVNFHFLAKAGRGFHSISGGDTIAP